MKKKISILLTGSNGYVGRNIKEYLENKCIIYAPSRKELDLMDGSAVEYYLKHHRSDIIIHCALVGGSRKSEEVEEAFYQNTRMFFNIIRNKKYFDRMIFLGSGAEYDNTRPLVNIKETDFDSAIPKDEYGYHKYICSKFIQEVDYIVNLRIFGLFGKYEDYTLKFISNAICKNIFNLPITIKQNILFDYVFINDFVRIVEYFISKKPKEKFYNIGRGEKIDLISIANLINNLSQKKSEIIVKESGSKREYTCNNKRLKKELGNFSFTPFENSIKELYSWYESRKQIIDKELLLVDKE